MKKITLLLGLALLGGSAGAQTFDYQLYLDQNGNCTYDSGEPLIYNTPAWPQLLYLNNSSNVVTSTHSVYCGSGGIPVLSAAFPPTNTFVLNPTPYYQGFVPSTTCNVWNNNPYGLTVYFPVSSANPMSWVNLYSSIDGDTVVGTNKNVQACSNDTVRASFSVRNLFTCNTGVSPRTYSLYLNGTYFEEFTTTGMPWIINNVAGVNSFGRIEEYYGTFESNISIHTKLPSAFNSPGTYTLTLKTTQLYPSAYASLDESWLITSVPCTNVSGDFFVDCNSNCVKDAGDQSPGGSVFGFVTNGTHSSTFYPGQSGNFSIMVPASGTYTMTAGTNYTQLVTCSPTVVTFPGSTPVSTISFGFNSSALYDPMVTLSRLTTGSTNPGTSIVYKVCTGSLFNFACTPTVAPGGTLKVVIPPFMSYTGMSSGSAPTVITTSTGDTLVWTVPSFTSTICHSFSVAISNTISLATPFSLKAIIYPVSDIYAGNNTAVRSGTIGAPYDPNNKLAWSEHMLPNGDFIQNDVLQYTINFQNIGTAPAVNVMTIDTLDNNLDIATVRVLASSFPVELQIDQVSRQMTFRFNNINLPPQVQDNEGSQGHVRYEVKLKSGVPFNTIIYNRAHNYFDFTDPVATNQTSNKLVNPTAISAGLSAVSMKLVPNPADSKVIVSAGARITSLKVYNQMGQQCLVMTPGENRAEINLYSLAPGIYFLTATLEDGSCAEGKLIRE